MTADHEAQDVERLAAIIRKVDGAHSLGAAALAESVLSALAEAGYTVVKTEDVRWVVRVVGMNPTPLGVASEAIFGPFPSVDAASDWLDTYRTKVEVHLAPQIMPLWVPVPEGSAETKWWDDGALGIAVQQHTHPDDAYTQRAEEGEGHPQARASHEITGHPGRSITGIRLAEGSADRGSEEGGEQ